MARFNVLYTTLDFKFKNKTKMKKYFKWLKANTKIKRASFKIFWAIMYIIFLAIIIHEAVADTPWALVGLIPLGAMMLYQWLEFKSDNKTKQK